MTRNRVTDYSSTVSATPLRNQHFYTLFILDSGHGDQVDDEDNDEEDGKDEGT